MRKYLASILAIILVCLTFTSCDRPWLEENKSELKWFLKSEHRETAAGEFEYDIQYEYDEYGRLIADNGEYDMYEHTCSDFQYDEKGNVIYKLETTTEQFDSNSYETEYYYTYDDDGNCITEKQVTDDDVRTTTFTYDEKGNVIKEDYVIDGNSASEQYIDTFKLTYENDLCTQSVRETKIYVSGDFDSMSYGLCTYEYDENGNCIKMSKYSESDEVADGDQIVQVNGKNYKKYVIITYEWIQLEVSELPIVDDAENQIDENKTTTTTTTTTPARDLDNYGFYDMQADGVGLVEIAGYDFDEGYVLVGRLHNRIWTMLNGSIVLYSFLEEYDDDNYRMGKRKVDLTGTYNIVSNDILSVYAYGEGQGTLSIGERVVDGDVVILKGYNNGGDMNWWTIPENLIDWDRGIEEYKKEDVTGIYKMYLK